MSIIKRYVPINFVFCCCELFRSEIILSWDIIYTSTQTVTFKIVLKRQIKIMLFKYYLPIQRVYSHIKLHWFCHFETSNHPPIISNYYWKMTISHRKKKTLSEIKKIKPMIHPGVTHDWTQTSRNIMISKETNKGRFL